MIARGERRRRWTPEQKREIVAESLGPDLMPTEVARKHGVSTGPLYTWRQQVLGRRMRLLAPASASCVAPRGLRGLVLSRKLLAGYRTMRGRITTHSSVGSIFRFENSKQLGEISCEYDWRSPSLGY